jgi:CheY-like chemotaxis protein
MSQKKSSDNKALEDLRVLILDDDSFMCDVLVETLHQLGVHKIVARKDAPETLEFIFAQNSADAIDVLLCDLHMPGMDGIEFISELANRAAGVDLNLGLIIVSGADNLIIRMANLLADARGVNVFGVLKKPVARNDLLKELEKALS